MRWRNCGGNSACAIRANCFLAKRKKQFLGSIGVSGEISDFSKWVVRSAPWWGLCESCRGDHWSPVLFGILLGRNRLEILRLRSG